MNPPRINLAAFRAVADGTEPESDILVSQAAFAALVEAVEAAQALDALRGCDVPTAYTWAQKELNDAWAHLSAALAPFVAEET